MGNTSINQTLKLSTNFELIKLMEPIDPLISQMDSVSIDDPAEDPDFQFDEDLVAQFLLSENWADFVRVIEEMDKSKYKILGCSIFQAFKLRQIAGSSMLSGGTDDVFDFDHATKVITNLLLTTNGFKSIVRYVRLQFLYGLEKIKQQKEENKIQPETKEFIDERWRKIKPDWLRFYSEITGFELTKEMLIEQIQELGKIKRISDAIDFIHEFEIFDVEIDWKKGIRSVIDANQFYKLPSILEQKQELISFTLGILSNHKYSKQASQLIDKLDLDIKNYPELLKIIQKKAVKYYVFNYLDGPQARDYMPLWKLEDIISNGNFLNLILLI